MLLNKFINFYNLGLLFLILNSGMFLVYAKHLYRGYVSNINILEKQMLYTKQRTNQLHLELAMLNNNQTIEQQASQKLMLEAAAESSKFRLRN